jgi:methylglutaconyl-CoA hydratase
MLWPQNANKIIRTGYRIGPFVIEPVVTKIGRTAMAEMTLAAQNGSRLIGLLPKDCMHNTLRNHEELDKAMISALNYQVIILKLCWK